MLLAGGSGTRFWPQSRLTRPKQFLPLAGGEPLLLSTWKRARRLAPARRIWIAAPQALVRQVLDCLPAAHPENLIVEPAPRDTAPAIALACARVAEQAPDAVVGIFPTDHVIGDVPAFVHSVATAVRAAEEGALVCLGVRPTGPATGFGYLKCASRPRKGSAQDVQRFVEKPDLPRARQFLRAGTYLWNAGMFVWRVDRFMQEMERVAPRILRPVRDHLAGKAGAWNRATKQSIDFALMEKAGGVRVVPLDARWDDLGSWDAAARLGDGARDGASSILVDSPRSVVFSGGRMIAIVGLPDVTVVDTPDAVLVVSRGQAEKVRGVVDELIARGRRDLL